MRLYTSISILVSLTSLASAHMAGIDSMLHQASFRPGRHGANIHHIGFGGRSGSDNNAGSDEDGVKAKKQESGFLSMFKGLKNESYDRSNYTEEELKEVELLDAKIVEKEKQLEKAFG